MDHRSLFSHTSHSLCIFCQVCCAEDLWHFPCDALPSSMPGEETPQKQQQAFSELSWALYSLIKYLLPWFTSGFCVRHEWWQEIRKLFCEIKIGFIYVAVKCLVSTLGWNDPPLVAENLCCTQGCASCGMKFCCLVKVKLQRFPVSLGSSFLLSLELSFLSFLASVFLLENIQKLLRYYSQAGVRNFLHR